MSSPRYIIGAGLAGLIAAEAFPSALVVEQSPRSKVNPHRALLRFRSPDVGTFLRIPFRKVRVTKGVWTKANGSTDYASVPDINHYSIKTQQRLLPDRSITRLEPVDRWIAPPDLYAQLIERNAGRIAWEQTYLFLYGEVVVSTAPLWAAAGACGLIGGEGRENFRHSRIIVRRFRIPSAALHQTVYFPDPSLSVYRASITDDTMICEFVSEPGEEDYDAVCVAFGLEALWPFAGMIEESQHPFGKIAPCEDESLRRELIRSLTVNHNVYSLGRYATWRNILLDDVLRDIEVIKSLIAGDDYRRQLGNA